MSNFLVPALMAAAAAFLKRDTLKTFFLSAIAKLRPSTDIAIGGDEEAYKAVRFLITYFSKASCPAGASLARQLGPHLFSEQGGKDEGSK